MNDTVGAIVQYATIGLCAVCCPICIGVAICKCIIKRKEKAAKAAEIAAIKEANKGKPIQVDGGFALSSSSDSNRSGEDDEMREMRRERKRYANEMYN